MHEANDSIMLIDCDPEWCERKKFLNFIANSETILGREKIMRRIDGLAPNLNEPSAVACSRPPYADHVVIAEPPIRKR